ncbi:hypothetical protein, partial [Kingella kingae]
KPQNVLSVKNMPRVGTDRRVA